MKKTKKIDFFSEKFKRPSWTAKKITNIHVGNTCYTVYLVENRHKWLTCYKSFYSINGIKYACEDFTLSQAKQAAYIEIAEQTFTFKLDYA